MDDPKKFAFPQIRKIELQSFSLYARSPTLEVQVPAGVFCLAGANGLGKSTFLAAVNFALTGFVPDPTVTFLSADDYHSHHRESEYTRDFFQGRISELDRELASVTVALECGDTHVEFTRGVFSADLNRLEDTSAQLDLKKSKSEQVDPLLEEERFRQWIVNNTGLESFAQYAFLQHLVFTFDESRHLLLWDRRALNDVLHLAIGGDPARAQEAAQLRRKMDRADSLARNKQYQATNVRERIRVIEVEVGDGELDPDALDPDQAINEAKRLEAVVSKHQSKVQTKWGQLSDAEAAWARASSALSARRAEYDLEFSKHVHTRSGIEHHPVVAASLSEDKCAICGSASSAQFIRAKLTEQTCPLCAQSLSRLVESSESLDRLQEIDALISKARDEVSAAASLKERMVGEASAAEMALEAINKERAAFEGVNRKTLLFAAERDRIGSTLSRLRDELSELLGQKQEKIDERNLHRGALVKLQKGLSKSYAKAEENFVPLFQQLAKRFLGIDLYVSASSSEAISSIGLSLVVELRGTARRELFHLSESQRFFVDIALRMALAQYMSSPTGPASLLVDTPEGSLDIAYEATAGLMFAKFAESGHSLLMTANINTSQLLLRLARECGPNRMALTRMTTWADLSDVQMMEEDAIEDAYKKIEAALGTTA